MFFKQVSGHKFMFLDGEKNVCKMSNLKEIEFYREGCPQELRGMVPRYITEFDLVEGKDRIDLEEEFDIKTYCSTLSSIGSSSPSIESAECSPRE